MAWALRGGLRRGLATALGGAVEKGPLGTALTRLPNGLRVASEDLGVHTATIAVHCDTGSRYENERNNGVAHFLEHMLFKGTKSRPQTAFELEIENLGATINAYTAREQTVYYVKCLREHIPWAVELLADLLHNCKLGEGEIERERSVILREMEDVEQNLQEVVFDHMHTAAYKDGPLARTILGPVANINSISRADIARYIQEHYTPTRMVLCGVGGVSHEELVQLGSAHFGAPPDAKALTEPPLLPHRFHGGTCLRPDPGMPLCYGTLVVEGPDIASPDNIPLMIASTLIGIWERSNRGALSVPSPLAEKVTGAIPGAHSFQGFNTSYKDTGIWGVYFVAEPEATAPLIEAIQSQWFELAERLTDEEVERGKRLLWTNMVTMLDGTTPINDDIGRQLLFYGRRVANEELRSRIEAVETSVMRDVCRRYLHGKEPLLTAVGRTEQLPFWEQVRQRMLW